MADYTDRPFGLVCREVAGHDFLIFREMVSAEAIVRGNEKTLRMCEFDKSEQPLVIQIFGGKSETMARAAEIIYQKFQPNGIDINMGCPVPKIASKGLAGASLMKDHARATAIVAAIKKLGLPIPISVKTRLGWSREDEILEFAPKLAAAGVDSLTIHGRTKMQGYAGSANWEMIARVKKIVSIPVIANGDIETSEDIKKCLEITSADGVMIGRGALGNPWIFTGRQAVSMSDRIKIVLRHAHLHLDYYGPKSMATFRKHLLCYFKGLPGIKTIKMDLVKVETLEQLEIILGKLKNIA